MRLLDLDPGLLRPENTDAFERALDEHFPGWIGLVAAIVLCFGVGFFIASFVGRRLWALLEQWLLKLPVIRAIYPSAKQITSFFIQQEADKAQRFSRVCIVPFPGAGQWSIGFVMSDGIAAVDALAGGRHLTVFVPMSPTPVTGFVIQVPEAQVHPIDLSVDEAFKYYLTAGLAIPPRHVVAPAAVADDAESPATGGP